MKKTRRLNKLLSLLLVLALMASMTAVSAFSASAEEVDYDYTYTIEWQKAIPQEVIDDFDVYKWGKQDSVEATKAIVGPAKMNTLDPDAADAQYSGTKNYCHTSWHGTYGNYYLDFLAIPTGGYAGITWNKDKVVNCDIQVWAGAAYGRMAIAIGPEPGVLPISKDGNPDNETGLIIFMEAEGRMNVAGAIDPNSVRSNKEDLVLGIDAMQTDDWAGSPNFRTEPATADGSDMFGIDHVKQNGEGGDCPVTNITIKDGVLTIYDYFNDEVKVSVDLTCNYQGGYITFFKQSAMQGSWREISIKKYEDTPSSTKHSYGDWEVTKEATTEEAGEERRECANCDEYETREIPKLSAEGWVEEEGGKTYYENGEKVTDRWIVTDGKIYYVDQAGYLVVDTWIFDSQGFVKVDKDGAVLINQWVQTEDIWSYVGEDAYLVIDAWVFDSKGWIKADAEGIILFNKWVQTDGEWYYVGADGYMVTNKWMKDSKGWVYLGADGAMLTNKWCTDSKGWCYVGADGYAVTNCWRKDSKGWIWLDANGSMTKSKWIKDGNEWYYCDANGYMVTNKWQKDSKGWVYLGANGAMLTNKWTTDSKGWCYVGANGYAVTNTWKKDNTGWIYLDANGSMTKAKWVKDGGKWYYCDAAGYMVAGKSVKIGGKTYNFNASGVCTNP